jgi:hypothetical protein
MIERVRVIESKGPRACVDCGRTWGRLLNVALVWPNCSGLAEENGKEEQEVVEGYVCVACLTHWMS